MQMIPRFIVMSNKRCNNNVWLIIKCIMHNDNKVCLIIIIDA